MRSLTEGGEPLATAEEFWQYVHARPGRDWPYLSPPAPRSIQRAAALHLVSAIGWDEWLRMKEAVRVYAWHQARAQADDEDAPAAPIDADAARAAWEAWRDGLIQRYRLAGLVPAEERAEPPA